MARRKKSDTELQFGVKFDNRELARGVRESLRILSTFSKGIAREFAKLGTIALPKGLGEFEYGGEFRKKTATPTEKDIAAKKEQLKDPTRDLTEELQKSQLEDWKKDWETQFKMEQAVTSRMFKDLGKKTVGEERKIASWQYAEEVRAGDREKFGDYAKKIPLMAKREDIVTRIYDKTTQTTKELVRTILAQQKLTSLGLKWEIVSDVTKENLVSSGDEIGKITKDMSQATDMASILKQQLDLVNRQLEGRGLTEAKAISLGKKRLQLIKQIDEIENPKGLRKKGFFRTILDRFKSVSIYRGIRGILKELMNSFTTGLSGIASISKEFKASTSDLMSQLTKLRALSSVIFYQVLMNIAPTLTDITNGLVEMANKFALSMAIMRGSGKVVQINAEYWEEYKDAMSGALLPFDNFNILASQSETDFSKLFKEVDISKFTKEEKDSVAGYVNILGGVKDVLTDIWQVAKTLWTDIVKPILDTQITQFLLSIIGGIVKLLSNLGLLKTALLAIIILVSINKLTTFFSTVKVGITGTITVMKALIGKITAFAKAMISSATTATRDFVPAMGKVNQSVSGVQIGLSAMMGVIAYLITDKLFSSMGEEARSIVAPIMLAVSAITAITVAILALKGILSWGTALPALLTSIGVAVASGKALLSKDNLTGYATGGQFRTGDFFVANENGTTEMIASSNNGGGNVMNLDQWQSVSTMGFYNALVMYGAAKDEDGNFDIDRLATTIARNRAFKSELNRTNPRLGLV